MRRVRTSDCIDPRRIPGTGATLIHGGPMISRQLREIASWRLAAELLRRYPGTLRLIETHPRRRPGRLPDVSQTRCVADSGPHRCQPFW